MRPMAVSVPKIFKKDEEGSAEFTVCLKGSNQGRLVSKSGGVEIFHHQTFNQPTFITIGLRLKVKHLITLGLG